MRRSLPAALLLTAATLALSAFGDSYIVPAGRSPSPAEGETLTGLIPAKRLTPLKGETVTAAPADAIPWNRAGEYLDQTITIHGTVIDTKDIGPLTFLNFATDRAGTAFYAVVFKDVYGKLPAAPEHYFRGKPVVITGKVMDHKGRPQIQIKDVSQIKVIDPNVASPTGEAASAAGASTAAPAGVLSWAEGSNHIGQTITIQGKVHSTRDIGNLTFINFTDDRSAFYFVIFSDAYAEFPQPPEQYLKGKTVRVTGKVTLHRDRAQIEVRKASQVEVVQ